MTICMSSQQKRVSSLFVVLLIAALPAYATTYTCATTLITVKIGDKMDAVKAACGDPTTVVSQVEPVSTPVHVVRWVYGVRPSAKSFFIPLFSLLFENRTLLQIEKNNTGAPLLGFFSCVDSDMLKIGLSMEEALALCGTPSSVNTTETLVNSTKPILIWTYNQGSFHDKVNFTFENGYLTHVKLN